MTTGPPINPENRNLYITIIRLCNGLHIAGRDNGLD